ncbi:MAG: ice-binding family protein, partial [Thermoplasmataceae archaeon]
GQYSTSTLVNGRVYAADYSSPTPSMLTTAVLNMDTAYTNAADRPDPKAVGLGNGNLGGMTITPGLYKWTTGVTIPTNLVLSGGPDSVWIFQISGGLTVGSGAHVILTGGAQAKNIFWQVGSGVTLGTGSSFSGTILSKTLIAMDSGATLNGSALAQTAVTLIGDRLDSSGTGQGTSVTQNATYLSEFMETGLPQGKAWYVNITGTPGSGPITGTSYSVSVPNGSYNYTIGTSDSTYRSVEAGGSFRVNGTQSSTMVIFTPVKYTVTFTETGLPQGTAWYVNITGQNSSGELLGSSYSVNLTNGSYAYNISYPSYVSRDYSGNFTVNGSPVPLTIPFALKGTSPSVPNYLYDIIAAAATIAVLAFALIVVRFHRR